MFFAFVGICFSASNYYEKVYIPCDVETINDMSHCEACYSKYDQKLLQTFASCIVCESGYQLFLAPNETMHYCALIPEPTPVPTQSPIATQSPSQTPSKSPEPTQSPEQTPSQSPEQTPTASETPSNCPPCICDSALQTSMNETINQPKTDSYSLFSFILQCITFFMVSYLFFKEWKPIICNCPKRQYETIGTISTPATPERPISTERLPSRHSSSASTFSDA